MSDGNRAKYLWLLGVVLAGACLAAAPAYDQYEAWRLEGAYRKGDGDAKRATLRAISRYPTARTRRVILQALRDPIPLARSSAGHAIFLGRFSDLADDLWAAAQHEKNSRVRSNLIVDWSQLVGRASEKNLRQLANSKDAYVRLAVVRGLLHLGCFAPAEDLFRFAAGHDRFKRRDAQRELLWLVRPMGEMIGAPAPVPDGRAGRWSTSDLDSVHAWWRQHVTRQLLKDYVTWRYDKPEDWKKVDTLRHEWEKRSPGFLPTGDDEADQQ